jgi:hypothetical protein
MWGNKSPTPPGFRSKLRGIKPKEILINDKAKIAVWGTGHHTSRLLGNSNLSHRNISPFNPADIANGEVDVILISSYAAQYAIINSIKQYNVDCNYIALY